MPPVLCVKLYIYIYIQRLNMDGYGTTHKRDSIGTPAWPRRQIHLRCKPGKRSSTCWLIQIQIFEF